MGLLLYLLQRRCRRISEHVFHVVYTRPRIRLETAAEPFRTNALPDNVVTASSVESLWHHLKAFLL